MSVESDLLLDRRRLKRRLGFWRIVAVLAIVGCVFLVARPTGAGLGRPHLARVTVSGIITEDRALTEAVTALAGDDLVRGVVVFVDSPGGSVAGGESLHGALVKVAAAKPVVTVMGGTAASAGYMVAVPAARIFAREATLTGSIGVLLETGDVNELLNSIGVHTDAIVSGPLKNQPSYTKPLSPAGREVLQALVLDMYDQFVGMVAAGRHLDPARVRELADGRAYTGRQALKLGLVDAIGGESEARDWLAAEKHVDANLPLVDLKPAGFARRAFGASLGGFLGMTLKSALFQGLTVDGAWALWQPGAS